ncbi:hypothetical protein [Cellulophaga sp. Hel_I_12]|uniref:hypothetical protein n=1 Tax=Cellulophaga sp. Hel_I_12 TaxID=1249972 RepID=UPI0006459390|nr:hypothetical protein [Cellulophaga sp. Hel_I_12]
MHYFNLLFHKVPLILLLISCHTKSNQNNSADVPTSKEKIALKYALNENTITVNGTTFNVVSDPCVTQINDDHSLMTFKASNDDLEYSLTVVLGVYSDSFNNGNYSTNLGDTEEDFMVITFKTEDGTFTNTQNSFVAFSKNGNDGIIVANDISLSDTYEALPNIDVSFHIRCTL